LSEGESRRSLLDVAHRALGAVMAEDAGWVMPARFGEVDAEVQAVRTRAGVLDLSPRSRLFLTGSGALPLLQNTLSYDPVLVEAGTARLNLLCDENGGILDLVTLYRLGPERWLLGGAPGGAETSLRWLQAHRRGDLEVRLDDRRESTALVALTASSSSAAPMPPVRSGITSSPRA
jgi:aminomethyltransferase